MHKINLDLLNAEEQLLRLLREDISFVLERFGSLEEMIQTGWRDSDNPERSELIFLHALRNLVSETASVVDKTPQYLIKLLQLIAAFRPLGGDQLAVRVLHESSRMRSRMRTSKGLQSEYRDVYLHALVALEVYFQVPGSHSSGQFRLYGYYVNVLRLDVREGDFAAEAMRRLLELNELTLGDQETIRLIQGHDALLGALRYALSLPSGYRQSEASAAIYNSIVSVSNDTTMLENVLKELDVRLVTRSTQVWTGGEAGDAIEIPDTVLETYLELPGNERIELTIESEETSLVPLRILQSAGRRGRELLRVLSGSQGGNK